MPVDVLDDFDVVARLVGITPEIDSDAAVHPLDITPEIEEISSGIRGVPVFSEPGCHRRTARAPPCLP